jgi:hypothetical protein
MDTDERSAFERMKKMNRILRKRLNLDRLGKQGKEE